MKYSYVNKEPHEIFQDILDGKIGRFPANYWKQSGVEEVASSITRYFIEVVLGWNDVEIKNINEKVFRQYRLSGMLEYVFNRSPFRAINNAYPGKYKPWELHCIPKGFWKEENNRAEALRYLLEHTQKTKINELTNKDFFKYGLGGLMDYLLKYNLYKKLDLREIEIYNRGMIQTEVSFSVTNTKSNRNMIRARLELPVEMLEEIGVIKEKNLVNVKIENRKIIIEGA